MGVVWPYGGGLLYLAGLTTDRKYRGAWIGGLVGWIGSLAFLWQLWPFSHPSPGRLRVGSFNMDAAHYRRPQIERLIDSLRRWHPDILCLQEVYLGDYSAKAFAQKLGYPYFTFLDAGGHTGMFVAAKWPIQHSRNLLLLPGTTNGLQEVVIGLPSGEKAKLLNVHFPSYRLGRKESWSWGWWRSVWSHHRHFAETLWQHIQGWRGPLWVCGDFNALPYHPLYLRLWQKLHDAFYASSWGEGPTWKHPWLRIDYIWSNRPAQLYQVRWIPAQAHGYVEAHFSLEGKPEKPVPLQTAGR